jgi:hypothetical protein
VKRYQEAYLAYKDVYDNNTAAYKGDANNTGRLSALKSLYETEDGKKADEVAKTTTL